MQEAVNDLVDHFGARNLEKHDKVREGPLSLTPPSLPSLGFPADNHSRLRLMAVCLWVLQKCFLLGEGLGAALALKAYINQGAVRIWDGLLMVSPTLAFPPRFKPWPMLTTFLRLGEAPIAPSSQEQEP